MIGVWYACCGEAHRDRRGRSSGAGTFTSEDDLAEQMLAFIETYNQTAKPFKWTYTGKVLEA